MNRLYGSAGLALFLTFSTGTATAQAPCDRNLLINPGCDEDLVAGEIPGWTEVQGSGWTCRSSTPSPHSGPGYFYASIGDTAELVQDVDLSMVDGYPIRLQAAIRTGPESPSDLARVVFEFRDQDGMVLATHDSGETTSPNQWDEMFSCCESVPGTVVIRVRLIGVCRSDTDINAYFDWLEVMAICGLPAEKTTWGHIKSLEP